VTIWDEWDEAHYWPEKYKSVVRDKPIRSSVDRARDLLREADLCDLGDLLQALGCTYVQLRRGAEKLTIEKEGV